jgi:hypothetical protein
MAVPEAFLPLIGPAAGAIQNVATSVHEARYGRRADDGEDEEGHEWTAGDAIDAVETAAEAWFDVADTLDGAIDEAIAVADVLDQDVVSELRACQSALMLLHLAVLEELALVQPLEVVSEDLLLAAVPGWPGTEVAGLLDVAFGGAGASGTGLVALLSSGTDDGPWTSPPVATPPPILPGGWEGSDDRDAPLEPDADEFEEDRVVEVEVEGDEGLAAEGT